MLELQNIKPELITRDNATWFQPLFKACFDREELWSQHLGETKYEAFHIGKQAFIFTYTIEEYTDLLTLGVHPDQRKHGLATFLLEWIIAKAPKAQKFFLDVECRNTAAISLYKKIGFEMVSIRKGYYPQSSGPAIDAYVMAYQKPPKTLS
jgi:ribosomal protein S18 acetylase RimI-like enzyme